MNNVLIVSKTHMHSGRVCVGGHDIEDHMRSLRLLDEHGAHPTADTDYRVGEVWEVDYRPAAAPAAPHVEDVHVRGASGPVRTVEPLGAFLREHIKPWTDRVFDGTLAATPRGKGYVPAGGPLPRSSTGYWLAPRVLEFDPARREYQWDSDLGVRRIKYVGVAPADDQIPAGALLRLSLAHLWAPDHAPSGYYLQLSGWYPA